MSKSPGENEQHDGLADLAADLAGDLVLPRGADQVGRAGAGEREAVQPRAAIGRQARSGPRQREERGIDPEKEIIPSPDQKRGDLIGIKLVG